MRSMLAIIGVVVLSALVASDVYGLEIQVAPQTLVVSSGGDNLTVHTNYRGFPPAGADVILEVMPEGGDPKNVPIVFTKLDDRGYYVVRCDREAAADAVGEFKGKRTTATVILTIREDSASEVITVRK